MKLLLLLMCDDDGYVNWPYSIDFRCLSLCSPVFWVFFMFGQVYGMKQTNNIRLIVIWISVFDEIQKAKQSAHTERCVPIVYKND